MASLVNGLGGNVGFGETGLPRMDDSPPRFVDVSTVFANGLNFYGKTYTELYVNYNGSITFGSGLSKYSPTAITGNSSIPIIAPYWADTDTRGGTSTITPGGNSQGTNQIYFDRDTVNKTFTATWDDVGYYFQSKDKLNAFQVQLVAVGTLGDFDIHFIYETLQWTTGDASGGTDGFGGLAARAGFSAGDGVKFFEISQSGTADMVKLTNTSNVGLPGHYVFSVRNGVVSLFTGATDTVDFNNLTADQKASVAGGSNIYNGLGGGDTVILPSPANYNQVVGKTQDGVDIKLGWTDTAASTFTTGSLAGQTYVVEAGEGHHFIVTGAGDDTVNILGSGNNKVTIGGGNATVLIDVATTDGSNTIVGGSGNETITLRSSATADGSGTQDISVGTGTSKLTVDGRFFANIHGGADAANAATFSLISIDDRGGNSPISLDGFADATSLMIESESSLWLKPDAFLKANAIKSTDGTAKDPGLIIVDADATLEIGGLATGSVRLGSGTSTLILDNLIGVGFVPAKTDLGLLESTFSISNIAYGDKILLRGVDVATDPVKAATLGHVALDVTGDQLALQLQFKSDIRYIAIDAVNGSSTWANDAYFKVESANGNDTMLTLVPGNNFADSVGSGQARQKYGLDGTGVRVGIISDSFANDAAGYQRDLQLGILPNVTILSDNLDGYLLSGGIDEGRAMAQIIHAIAPGASLYFSATGSASVLSFVASVDALVAAGCDIIVDDVGFGRYTDLDRAVDDITTLAIMGHIEQGVTFVTAAGNDRQDGIKIYGHARYSDIISVAAVNVLAAPSAAFPNGQYLLAQTEPYSSEGDPKHDKPDLSGPDQGQTTLPLADQALNPFPGTSAAAPAVAAVAALMMQYNPLLNENPRLVQALLENSSFQFGEPTTAGAGFVQAEAAVGLAYGLSPAFYRGPSNAPAVEISATPESLSASPAARLVSAALSTVSGNASTDKRVLLLLTLDQGMIVTGTPSLTLNTGGLATYDSRLSTPSAGRLLFEYTVGAEQEPDLQVTGLTGSIKDGGGNAADLSSVFGLSTGLTINSPLKIQGVTSTHNGVAFAGETIEVTVTLSSGAALDSSGGAPTLTLSHGATALYDAANSNLAAGKLVFDYKIGSGEATPDVSLSSIDLPIGSWLRDANGNNADLSLTLDRSAGVQVGPAFVTDVFPAIEQTALPTGQSVDLTIVLSQSVVVDRANGSPTLLLSNGAFATYDLAASDASKGILVFEYEVGASDAATGNLMVSKTVLNGATIRDASGLDVNLAGTQGAAMALTIQSPLGVDTTMASKSGAIRTGESVQLTIAMEKSLHVLVNANSGGPPTLALNDGGTAFYNALASDLPNGKLVFDYKVGASAQATASLVITKFNQNGAILFDDNGNFADLAGALNVPTGLKVVVASSASIEATAAIKPEGQSGSSAFVFTARLDGAAATSETVAWAVSGSGANPAGTSDFAGGVLASGVVTFAAGETSKAVVVTVVGDTAVEASESFTVTLSAPSAGLVIGTATASGTIVNDDAAVSIAATAAAKAEGNAGSTASTFTVTRSGDTAVSQTVAWAVSGSGANPATATDFAGGLLPSGIVAFGAGETAKTIVVSVQGDAVAEADESYVVTLSNPSSGLTIGTAAAAGTIQNDDAALPTAYDDAYVTLQGKAVVAAPATIGVLANDLGGPSLTASHQGGPSHGSLLFSSTGGFTYTPHAGYSGIDTFKYRAGNGSVTDDGQAVVYVVPVSTGAATTLNLLALTAEEQIAATYAAFFGRAVDSGGFGFWVGEFNRLLPVQGPAALFANIASSFGISDEAKALYPFLASPFNATDGQIGAFLQSVYTNLFNRGSDAGGLAYWTDQIKQSLQAGQFVGSVLVNIMSGAQDTAAGQDITTLMGKVAVSLEYAHEQIAHQMSWLGNSDRLAATSLLQAVTSAPQTVLTGIRTAEDLVAAHP